MLRIVILDLDGDDANLDPGAHRFLEQEPGPPAMRAVGNDVETSRVKAVLLQPFS